MAGRIIQILDPTAQARLVETPLAPPLGRLEGRTVGLLNNKWPSMDAIAARAAELLQEKYRVAEVLHRDIPITSAAPAALLNEVAAKADLAVVGLAN